MTRIVDDWVTEPKAQAVCAMLTEAGFQAYFVGGCVRNALMGVAISDVDLATDAEPQDVMTLAETAGFRAVPTGVDHGTVTIVVSGHPFEVTTFRKDIETHGRHATVLFAKTLQEDAHRRDFTMNALYADPNGNVVDPLDGLEDLRARRVRFIDDPDARIREDYLRILRFFRFHAWYGDPTNGLDQEGLAAVSANLDGLATLSRERVGQELKKLLAAPDPGPSVATLEHSGALARILPGATSRMLPVLVHLEQLADVPADPIRRLASIGGSDHQDELRLSKDEGRRLTTMLENMGIQMDAAALSYQRGFRAALDIVLLNCAALETDLPKNLQSNLVLGSEAKFPIAAADLMPDLKGAALGNRLRLLEAQWVNSGFRLTRDDLLS